MSQLTNWVVNDSVKKPVHSVNNGKVSFVAFYGLNVKLYNATQALDDAGHCIRLVVAYLARNDGNFRNGRVLPRRQLS